jgi:hypothetical protein
MPDMPRLGLRGRRAVLAATVLVPLLIAGAFSTAPGSTPSPPASLVLLDQRPASGLAGTCPNSYYYGSGTQLTLQNVVDCAGSAGFSGDLEITFVSMSYQESTFCPGAIESGSGPCSDTGPGCSGNANAEGILQEGTAGQCPPTGGPFSVSGYSASSCSTWSGSSSDWGGIYFNPLCSFQWALAYYNVNGYAFWGSYLSGAYCNWAPNGFLGTGSVTCSGTNQNQANLPWSTVCPNNVCPAPGPAPLAASYSMNDNTTSTALTCGASFEAGDAIFFTADVTGGSPPYAYAWTFGDGTSGTTNPITHPYAAAGTVTPLLTVTDSAGNTASTGTGCSFTVSAAPTPTISSFTVSPSTIALGGTTFVNTTAAGGTPPYSYAYTGLPPGCVGADRASLTCAPTSTGIYSIGVTVTDARSQTASASGTLTVTLPPDLGPTIGSFTISPATIPLGGTTYLNATVSGGVSPYSYAYSGLPAGCTGADAEQLTCAPSAAGSYSVTLAVTDADGKTASASASFTVTATAPQGEAPVIGTITAFPASLLVGGTTFLNVTVASGNAPYTYAFSGLPAGCASASMASLRCVPTAAGSFSVSATVSNAYGTSPPASVSLTVKAAASPLSITAFTAGPASIDVGWTSELNVSVTGGSLPYVFDYSGLPAGCASANQASLDCAPSAAGSFVVTVSVTDGLGATATRSVSLFVEAPSSPAPASPPKLLGAPLTSATLLITSLLAIVVVAGAAVAVVVHRRRSRGMPPAPPETWTPPGPPPFVPPGPPPGYP